MTSETKHLDEVRKRFTETAETFRAYSVRERGAEANHVAECVTAGLPDTSALLAVDVACGPGTLTFPLAARVGRVIGIDITPAMIETARREAARKGLQNIEFILGDASSLPLADASADIVTCGNSVHHIPEPARVLAEMVRILRPGGRLAILDLILIDCPNPAANNAIERVRDPSHTTKLTAAQFRALYQAAGLRVLTEEVSERRYDFDEWMRTAGRLPGDPSYAEARRMMEDTIPDDAAGFHPSYSATTGALEFVTTILLLVGEKPR
jgi:ubiquinone/menaquinone biosynthesis C-methylase UbiE